MRLRSKTVRGRSGTYACVAHERLSLGDDRYRMSVTVQAYDGVYSSYAVLTPDAAIKLGAALLDMGTTAKHRGTTRGKP